MGDSHNLPGHLSGCSRIPDSCSQLSGGEWRFAYGNKSRQNTVITIMARIESEAATNQTNRFDRCPGYLPSARRSFSRWSFSNCPASAGPPRSG